MFLLYFILSFYINLELASNFDSNSKSNSEADLEPYLFPNLLLSKPFSKTSIPCLKHSIRTRIQAVSFLELNILYFEITTKTGISKV
jgi:hypothetical protein